MVMDDSKFMKMAEFTAERYSTCRSKHAVGAIIINDGRVLADAANSQPEELQQCDDPTVGSNCVVDIAGRCTSVVHAEIGALLLCAKFGLPTRGGTMYVTHEPCDQCSKAIILAGIKRVVYGQSTSSSALRKYAEFVEIVHLTTTPADLTKDRFAVLANQLPLDL
jgi:dCMP deaminase